MALTHNEISGLLRLIGLTEDQEIDCETCLTHVAEFAEQELAGKSVSDGLEAVRHHLAVCAECCEEYEALCRVLGQLDAG